MRILALLFALGLFAISAFSQDYEYGKAEELKGLKTIYIDTKAT